MLAGNINPQTTIKMDYLDCSKPPFVQTALDKRIVVRPHQTKSLVNLSREYHPPKLGCPVKEIDCVCALERPREIFSELIGSVGTNAALLWLDPRFLKTECLASLIVNWKRSHSAAKNVALGIVVPEGNISQKTNGSYELWGVHDSGPIYNPKLDEPVWYPSLARDCKLLDDASKNLDPYDVFPLVEFSRIATQAGERDLTDHCSMLERSRTRTRNFVYLDVSRPDLAFERFYGTIGAIPRIGSPVLRPVVTPGGSVNGFLIALLSGVFADAYFLTPKEEIPVDSNADANGIMILRKCT